MSAPADYPSVFRKDASLRSLLLCGGFSTSLVQFNVESRSMSSKNAICTQLSQDGQCVSAEPFTNAACGQAMVIDSCRAAMRSRLGQRPWPWVPARTAARSAATYSKTQASWSARRLVLHSICLRKATHHPQSIVCAPVCGYHPPHPASPSPRSPPETWWQQVLLWYRRWAQPKIYGKEQHECYAEGKPASSGCITMCRITNASLDSLWHAPNALWLRTHYGAQLLDCRAGSQLVPIYGP